ncbi:MAG: hypothetical protein GY809_02415 [Planctomycetes bacterium]|nr:hypothetical protein [Planctomycetota bacterium]
MPHNTAKEDQTWRKNRASRPWGIRSWGAIFGMHRPLVKTHEGACHETI